MSRGNKVCLLSPPGRASAEERIPDAAGPLSTPRALGAKFSRKRPVQEYQRHGKGIGRRATRFDVDSRLMLLVDGTKL